jgi:hypothetical protein
MSWPTTKAGTTNIDAGSDKPALARPDIKQNIDNVNAIIDEFDIASPSNGDILTYNSSSGAWEPGASTGGGAGIAILNISTGGELVSGNEYRRTVSVDYDTFDFLTQNGSYQVTLGAGTYLFEPIIQTDGGTTEVAIVLWDETTDASLGNVGTLRFLGGTTTSTILTGFQSETFGSTTNVSFRQTAASSTDRNISCRIRVTKL